MTPARGADGEPRGSRRSPQVSVSGTRSRALAGGCGHGRVLRWVRPGGRADAVTPPGKVCVPRTATHRVDDQPCTNPPQTGPHVSRPRRPAERSEPATAPEGVQRRDHGRSRPPAMGRRRPICRAARDRARHLLGRSADVEGAAWGEGQRLLAEGPRTGARSTRRRKALHRSARHQGPDAGAKAALVDDPDSPFFTIDHFRNSNAVLVQQSRLGELTVAELREILTEAWLSVAPRRLAKEHFG